MKYDYLICILQHRSVNYSISSFLHLHATLKDSPDMRSRCKVVFACTSRDSKELEVLKLTFSDIYNLDIFECDGEYNKKLESIFREYSCDDYKYFVKVDEDIFLSPNTWKSILSNAPSILKDPNSFLVTANLSTGIPSWSRFAELFFSKDAIEHLYELISVSKIPNMLWGCDYSKLSKHVDSKNVWDEKCYWNEMNSLPCVYKGLHPVRLDIKIAKFINEFIIQNYNKFTSHSVTGDYFVEKDRYFCNSFFCIEYSLYKSIVNDESLKYDDFDEVSINNFSKKNDLGFAFLDNSIGVHLLYNSIYENFVRYKGKNYIGMVFEKVLLNEYKEKILRYLESVGDDKVAALVFERNSLKVRFIDVLKNNKFVFSTVRLLKSFNICI